MRSGGERRGRNTEKTKTEDREMDRGRGTESGREKRVNTGDCRVMRPDHKLSRDEGIEGEAEKGRKKK